MVEEEVVNNRPKPIIIPKETARTYVVWKTDREQPLEVAECRLHCIAASGSLTPLSLLTRVAFSSILENHWASL